MAMGRPQIPGVGRSIAWVPIDDTTHTRSLGASGALSARRDWTPFGLTALGHQLRVNVSTGALTIAAADLSIPYHAFSLAVNRTFDTQQQYTQSTYLREHPNTDPRFHFFGNWQFQREAYVAPTWHDTYPELLVSDGDGDSGLFYREYRDFEINTTSAAQVERQLRSYGIPGRTLSALAWKHSRFDHFLRTRQGVFRLMTGHFEPETMVDPVSLRLWVFDPIKGNGYKYTSEYAYQRFVDKDGLRETTVQTVLSQVVDGLGHTVSFAPLASTPPHRAYRLIDGAGRSFLLALNAFVTYLDGERLGGKAKTYLVTRVTDETRSSRNVIKYQYDEGRLIQVSYPGHAGRPIRIVKYNYDKRGNIIRITDPLGDSLNLEYVEDLLDSDHRLLPRLKIARISDSEGNSAAYRYDHPKTRVVVTFTGPNQPPYSLVYGYFEDEKDTGRRYITSEAIDVTLGYGGSQTARTQWRYSGDGRFLLLESTDPLGNITRDEFNSFNQVTATIDSTGHRRDYQYDIQGSPTAAQPNRYDLIQASETNVDAKGNIFPVKSAQQFQQYDATTSADAADKTQSTHRVSLNADENGHVTAYKYDDQPNFYPLHPTELVDALGKITRRTYDAHGGVLSEMDPEKRKRGWLYNAQGQLILQTDPNGFQRHWVYDLGTGWITDITDALGSGPGDPAHSTHYEWNDAGQRTRDRDAVSAIADYIYFRNKRLRSITRYDPAARQTTFDYDTGGALIAISGPDGHSILFRYDEAGRLYETFRDSAANPSIRFKLDAAGRVTLMTDRNGKSTQYKWDVLGRVISIREPNWPAAAPVNPGKLFTFKYDKLSRILVLSDSQLPGDCVYDYDRVGNLKSRTDHYGWSLNYSYDARNGLSRLNDAAGVIDLQFSRDDSGRLVKVTDSAYLDPSRTFRYVWMDGALIDNLYRVELVSRIKTRFEYDRNRQVTLVEHEASGSKIASFGYTYRADGLVDQAKGDHQGSYDYDGIKQLVRETDVGVRNAYDGAGNRLWRAGNPVAVGQQNAYDADNRLLSTPADGTTYKYDANGNLVLRKLAGGQRIRYEYDGANRLMSVDDGAQRIEYVYDYEDRLLQRSRTTAGATVIARYRHGNRSILASLDGQNGIQTVYTRDDGGRLLRCRKSLPLNPAPTRDPHSLYYLQDGLQNVCRLIDWDGAVRTKTDYDAWGAVNSQGAASLDNFHYRGGYQDPDTGFLHFSARWYDPNLSRWMVEDPLLAQSIISNGDLPSSFDQLLNLYRYANNNPIAFQDAKGLEAEELANATSWEAYDEARLSEYLRDAYVKAGQDPKEAWLRLKDLRQERKRDLSLAAAEHYAFARYLGSTWLPAPIAGCGIVLYIPIKLLGIAPRFGNGPVTPFSWTQVFWQFQGLEQGEKDFWGSSVQP